jgi:methyl-accepting chemotaxis protein
MKKSIKQEVIVRVALILLVVIVTGLMTINGMKRVKKYSEATGQAADINALVLTAEKAHYGWVENLCSSISMGTEFTGSTNYQTCVLGNWLYGDTSTIEDKEMLRIMEEMKPIHQTIHESAETILQLNETDHEAAKDMYLNTTKANVEKLVALLEQVSKITQQEVLDSEAGLSSAVLSTKIASIVAIVVTVIAIVLLFMYVLKGIIAPIQKVIESSKGLSEGRLDFHIDVKSTNEIGVLADSLNTSVNNLNLYISDITSVLTDIAAGNLLRKSQIQYIGDFIQIQHAIETISKSLSQTMEQIHASASQVDAGANQVADGAQNLAQGATEQASEVDNLMNMIEEISQQIDSSNESVVLTTKQADDVGERITVCNGQMQEMAEAMRQISACSDEIQHIIKTIDDIAFQTNILALNAAVEAARAGSAGKGFAVVADEVRNLAAKSADAVKDTAELIDKTLRMVDTGSRLTNLTQESLQHVVEGAGKVTEEIKVVYEASQQQEEEIGHIKESITQISTVIQSNSATSEESAAASEELAGQAQVLKTLIAKFKFQE